MAARVTTKSRFDDSGHLSKLFFWWMVPLFRTGWKKDLQFSDFDLYPKDDDPERLTRVLEDNWNYELKIKRRSLMMSLVRTFLPSYAWQAIILGLTECTLRMMQPLLIGNVVRYFKNKDDDNISSNVPFYSCFGIILSTIVFTFVRNHFHFFVGRMGINIQSSLTVLIYKKLLKLSSLSLKSVTVGMVTNIISNDVAKCTEIGWTLAYLVICPIQTIIVMIILWQYLGSACIFGIIILILLIPFQMLMGKLFNTYRRKTTKLTDERVNLMTEIITAIKVIKMYCWEKPFIDSLNEVRREEVNQLKWLALLEGLSTSISSTSTRIILFVSFITFVISGGHLDVETVFVTISLFNVITPTMTKEFPHAMSMIAECLVTTKRIKDILVLEEKHSFARETLKKGSVCFNQFSGKWNSGCGKESLKKINFVVNPGELVVVIGSVGSGKSCLLYAVLSEIERVSGSLSLNGKISYSPQESWCFGGSIKENILLGEPMDRKKYQAVIKACGLERDLKIFPAGDQTFVGEKGYTLSGGQKARVTLARAVYRDADIYLLDDPLSAVDPHVANHIFDECINGYLKEKTVILITHQLQFLQAANKIVVMNDGCVSACGTFEELRNSGFDTFVKYHVDRKISESDLDEASVDTPEVIEESIDNGKDKVVHQEKIASGSVGANVYWKYFTCGSSSTHLLVVLIITIASQVSYNYNDYWLSSWTESSRTNEFTESENRNVLVYTVLMICIFVLFISRVLLTYFMCLNCSNHLHNQVFKSVIGTNMNFFERNPVGRILNRFTNDIGCMDQVIPYRTMELNVFVIESIGILIIVSIANPWLMIPASMLILVSIPIRTLYLRTARDLKRLESAARSPVYSHLSATFDGLTTIRSHQLETRFIQQYLTFINDLTSTSFMSMAVARGINFALDLLSLFYVIATYVFISYSTRLDSGMVGVILSNSSLLIGMFQFAVRATAKSETIMISVERVLEYENLPAEPQQGHGHHEKWPIRGSIQFKDVSLSYQTAKDVLKSINFKVDGGEKIGIVGRTGAGKSSLISVLFRLVEPDGTILIDGVDTRTVGLKQLRSSVSIIPQDPVLFSGTVRKNLDPFNEYSNEVLWECLESANIATVIQGMDGTSGLESIICNGGSNLSVGQRQLLCLARALLKKNQILVLDEATANVDQETDELIQKTIKSNFTHCTVLTIAHRLNTIIDSDKVLVLDAGQVVEFDAPHNLLSQPSGDGSKGKFKEMVNQTGNKYSEMLHKAAEEAFESRRRLAP